MRRRTSIGANDDMIALVASRSISASVSSCATATAWSSLEGITLLISRLSVL
jgi:hypothetical protein